MSAAAFPASSSSLAERATSLGVTGAASDESVKELVTMAAGERRALEGARDMVAARLHEHVDDYSATAALRLLNRSLSTMPRVDPLDWRVRWTQRFRKP